MLLQTPPQPEDWMRLEINNAKRIRRDRVVSLPGMIAEHLWSHWKDSTAIKWPEFRRQVRLHRYAFVQWAQGSGTWTEACQNLGADLPSR